MATVKPVRLLIIGIDGADHERVGRYMSDGTMPNLAALARRGAFLNLRSIIPPITPAAWTTITTGRNPGKHGLYEFQRIVCGAARYALADERRTPTLFHALNRHGLRVGLYNVPWTFPPDRYDGFVIGGMESLRLRPEMAWPPEAFAAFAEVVGEDYEPWPMIAPGLKLDADKVRRYVDLRLRVTQALLSRIPVDAYMVVFNMVDFVQHAFIGVSAAETVDGGRIDDPVRWVHGLVDTAVGHLLSDLAGPDTIVCVVSDHGMTIADRVVNMEKLFVDNGWLAVKGAAAEAGWSMALRVWRAVRGLLPTSLRDRIRSAVRRRVAQDQPMREQRDYVDWSRTVAAPFHAAGCIRLNLAGRDPVGIVPPDDYQSLRAEIAERLLSLRFPGDGEPVFEAVPPREELFHGPAIDLAPDLVAVPTRYRYWMPAARGGSLETRHLLGQAETLAELDPPTGVHRLTGIMFAAGPGIEPGGASRASLIDVTPTLLHLLGLPVPEDVDGRPLADIMTDALRQRPVQREAEPEPAGQRERTELERDEQRQLEDRLRDLGYL